MHIILRNNLEWKMSSCVAAVGLNRQRSTIGCDKVKMPQKSREKSELQSSDPICETLVLGCGRLKLFRGRARQSLDFPSMGDGGSLTVS